MKKNLLFNCALINGLLFTIISLLFYSGGALAEVYTWTDEKGVTHFSTKQEKGAKAADLPEINYGEYQVKKQVKPATLMGALTVRREQIVMVLLYVLMGIETLLLLTHFSANKQN